MGSGSGPTFPFPRPRGSPFELAPEYAHLRREDPVARVSLANGRQIWLVTSHREARTVLSDDSFGTVAKPLHRAEGRAAARVTSLLHLDGPQHRRFRGILHRALSIQNVRAIEPRLSAIAERCLDAMEAAGPPAELVESFAVPIPLITVCEMLGIPAEDHAVFHQSPHRLTTIGLAPDVADEIAGNMLACMHRVVAGKRRDPADDLLSQFVTGDNLTDTEAVELGLIILLAGYEASAGMISMGAFLLMRDPRLRSALAGGEAQRRPAVEELLRYVSVIQFGVDRVARQDVVLAGRRIRAGDQVVAFLPAANRDPELVDDPELVEPRRPVKPHLAFGSGPHGCPGQQLARLEVAIALSQLTRRFPSLRLAVDEQTLSTQDDMIINGFRTLPITWM